ncbi:cyclic nucleotide-binding domain-containing protein [Nitratireductor sp. CAU 1489]|uniref:Cyclic nucleotide-binding domain-containing protein n=1 Tax=Nitratireductor arenosus TaxID=2682096 RepID=A0A844QD34_9HYPH|nr:Crp/Fnr family transcriptional regulator [Nitratireductor arenosus]MVA95901.1 cyclic nucleotide-binding domain-containing protein [Nitratireductor arenosus]
MGTKEDIVGNAIWAEELTAEELDRARRGTIEKTFAKGSYICHRGDKLDYWTGVVDGLAKISAVSSDGKAMTFAGATSGSWFGEGSVLKGEARQYDLVVLRDTRLAMMNRATFMWLYENSRGFSRFLVRQLNERMGQFIATIEYDRILSPRARVARNLSWFFNPVLYPTGKSDIEISQEELGLLAGVSRAVANRALQDLEEEGLLQCEHGRIKVIKLERLKRYEP